MSKPASQLAFVANRAQYESLRAGGYLSALPLLVSSYGSQNKIAEATRDMGVYPERMVTLYDELRVY